MIETVSPEMMAFAVGVAVAIGIVVFMPILKLVLDIAEFSYANTRVSGMNGALIKKKRYSELVDAGNIEEFVGMLEGTPYSDFLGKVGTNINENTVEDALEKEYASEKAKIVGMLPDSAKKVLGIYFKREEVRLIKNVMRRIASGYRNFDGLEPVGDISQNRLGSLVEAESVKDFVARLEGTEYYGPLNSAYQEYENHGNLIFLERAIDIDILNKIWVRIVYSNMPILREFVGREIDILNVMTCLRAKTDGIKGTDLEKYIVKGRFELSEKKLKELADAAGVQDVVSLLEGTAYGKVLSEVASKYGEGGLSVFEDALRRYRYGLARGFAAQMLHLGPVLGYLIRKENEVTNLKTIIKCKSINMGKDRIEGMLAI